MIDEEALTGEEDDDRGLIIVSLDVYSDSAIEELSSHSVDALEGRWQYSLGTHYIEELDSERRASELESTIDSLLDQLSAVDSIRLHEGDTWVRLFMTLSPGAQTLTARTLVRLAEHNVTMWIDA